MGKSKNLKLQVGSNYRGISILFWVLSPKTLLDSHGEYWKKKSQVLPWFSPGKGKSSNFETCQSFPFSHLLYSCNCSTYYKYLVFSIFFTIGILISVYPYSIMVLICISLSMFSYAYLPPTYFLVEVAVQIFCPYFGLVVCCLILWVIYIFWISSPLLDFWIKICLSQGIIFSYVLF